MGDIKVDLKPVIEWLEEKRNRCFAGEPNAFYEITALEAGMLFDLLIELAKKLEDKNNG